MRIRTNEFKATNGNRYVFEIEKRENNTMPYINIINIDTGSTRNVRVINSNEFVVKINKKSISAISGAAGLFVFLNDAINACFCAAWANVIVKTFE